MSINMSITDMLNRRKNVLKTLRAKRKMMTKIIKIRTSKPRFLRNLWWKFDKFQNNLKWKRPRGKDNPMRLALKGYPPAAGSGYRSPIRFRNIHPCGMKMIVVSTVDEIKRLDPNEYMLYISSNVGLKKKLEIVSIAKSMGFKIANE